MNRSSEETVHAGACAPGIANMIVGIIAYIFLVVPVLTITIMGVLNLNDGYGIAVAIALVMTGLYVAEKTACLDS